MYAHSNETGAVEQSAPFRPTWYILIGVLLYNVLADLRASGLLLDSWPRWQVKAAELIVAAITVTVLQWLAARLGRRRSTGHSRL